MSIAIELADELERLCREADGTKDTYIRTDLWEDIRVLTERNVGLICGALRASEPKPRGTYVPLDEEEIELIRAAAQGYGLNVPRPVDLGDCTRFLKEGETVEECIARNRADVDVVMGQLAQALKRAEAAEAALAEVRHMAMEYRADAQAWADKAAALEVAAPATPHCTATDRACDQGCVDALQCSRLAAPFDRTCPACIVESRSRLRRIAAQKGEPAPDFSANSLAAPGKPMACPTCGADRPDCNLPVACAAPSSIVPTGMEIMSQTGPTRLDVLVDRFLAWHLPESVCSDSCATERGNPNRTGTNLLAADEARQMLEHVLQGFVPSAIAPISGVKLVKLFKDERDEAVKLLQESLEYRETGFHGPFKTKVRRFLARIA